MDNSNHEWTLYEGKSSIERSSIHRVKVLGGVREIKSDAFAGCTNLVEIVLTGVNIIHKYAFRGCTKLTNVQLSDNLEIIGKGAFRGCKSLKYITIPGSVRIIEQSAFSRCDELQKMTLQEGCICIEMANFLRENLVDVYIPSPSFVTMNWHYEANLVLDGKISPPSGTIQLLVMSKFVKHMTAKQRQQANAEINELLGSHRHFLKISALFQKFEHMELTSLLELALWKESIYEHPSLSRNECRKKVGGHMAIIIEGVLKFL